jgi:hypothetical protein
MSEKARYSLQLDPNKQFTEVPDQHLIDCMGVLPIWCITAQNSNPNGIQSQVEKMYGFPTGEMTGGEIAEDGSYKYPEDPVMHPIASMRLELANTDVLFYQHAMIAFKDGENPWHMTRMD